MKELIDRLENSFVLTEGDRLLAVVGGYPVGAVAGILPTEDEAKAFIKEHQDEVTGLGYRRVGPALAFMQTAAGEGLAGVEAASMDSFPEKFMFMVRVDEAASAKPTVLVGSLDGRWLGCLTHSGIRNLPHADLLHWQRFDILDLTTGRIGQLNPFRDWEFGDPLFEIATDAIVVSIGGVLLFGHWASSKGAVPFFTESSEAEHFLKHHLGNGSNLMRFTAEPVLGTPTELMATLNIREVPDILHRLREIGTSLGDFDWCVNPDANRENAAIGRFQPEGGESPPVLRSVSGVWEVFPGNVFELSVPHAPWTGTDTIRWDGGQALRLMPFDRSVVNIDLLSELGLPMDSSDSEIEEAIHSLTSFSLRPKPLPQIESDNDQMISMFVLRGWDTVSRSVFDGLMEWSSFLDAIIYLLQYEAEHDAPTRVKGARFCGGIGFGGSGNLNSEELRSERFRNGLQRILKRSVRHYSPREANNLVSICNQVFSTFHIEYAGIIGDLIVGSSEDFLEQLRSDLEFDSEQWASLLQAAKVPVDPKGKKLVVDRVGSKYWSLLCDRGKGFLSTAMIQLDLIGHSPQMDYATVSLEVVKALEVEFVELYFGFKAHSIPADLKYDLDDVGERALHDFIAGKKAPTLGNAPYLLQGKEGGNSELRAAFLSFVTSLPNGEFLLSKAFRKDILGRVTNKYRNGGAHDSRIEENTCRQCVAELVGTEENLGVIFKVLLWKERNLNQTT